MLRINNLKIKKDLSGNEVISLALDKFHINKNDILNVFISKKSIDARKKGWCSLHIFDRFGC